MFSMNTVWLLLIISYAALIAFWWGIRRANRNQWTKHHKTMLLWDACIIFMFQIKGSIIYLTLESPPASLDFILWQAVIVTIIFILLLIYLIRAVKKHNQIMQLLKD